MCADEHLTRMLTKYDGWMREGKIPYAGKVLPVREAFRLSQWILPTQQAIEILRNAHVVALTECICRSHYGRCDSPLDTCLLTNDMANAFAGAGKAAYVSPEQAEEVLQKANVHGLVHQTLYSPEQYDFAVCSCCPCCCYRLQILKLFERNDLVVHSDYVAVVAEDRCANCGSCVDRCVFGARHMVGGEMIYDPEICYGCGLCVTACPQEAINLKMRRRELLQANFSVRP